MRAAAGLGLLALAALSAGCGGPEEPDDAAVTDGAPFERQGIGEVNQRPDGPSGGDGAGGDEGATCGATTCAGCCHTGVCYPGVSAVYCGVGGAACATCTMGVSCLLGLCGGPRDGGDVPDGGGEVAAEAGDGARDAAEESLGCSVDNCAGCCAGAVCLPGTADDACGEGGVACQGCIAMGKVCSTSKPMCVN